MKINVLITGAHGQLGRSLQKMKPPHWAVTALGSKQLDITDAQAVQEQVRALRPALIINAAAYNAVDRAEQERERAFAVNAQGPLNLARAANEAGARLVHVSSDYVFDGHSRQPYDEQAKPNPLNAYGESKLQGEKWLLREQPHAWVLRTAWVFSAEGQNFVAAMLKAAQQGRPLRVVDDQTGAPTFAGDLAQAIIALAGLAMAEPRSRAAAGGPAADGSRREGGLGPQRVPHPAGGVYHYSGSTALTRYEFARAIFQAANVVAADPAGTARAAGAVDPTGTAWAAGAVDPAGTGELQAAQPSTSSGDHPSGGHPGGESAARTQQRDYLDMLSPIPSSDYPSATVRPKYSVLSCSKMAALGIPPKPLAESLPGVVRALMASR
ncbi:dTDP-4-dehydrorhamnose reductase [Pusillimonas noertemannii]|uniref:dTDP-4-dehydrorhamnose reductase n=1 Tax=Pusillimonas noertemannii TaxID=305977 RepID=A0A2U1CPH9_9BURK|nr:dTDP-4-dehydrorhamnose reductase [Pusillimonas noertemannii]NYT67127.1 dTDP-4-dehydrorhamnose reductase [Pusillimonas noertemannii]PVY67802.1 dTDP-4-dehydrorhamnose reductase [Pusillimonas noertemannii]TFL12670.1 dTDP-4-dehydrorhamnose reductase [Pusillimonas noertemannii]